MRITNSGIYMPLFVYPDTATVNYTSGSGSGSGTPSGYTIVGTPPDGIYGTTNAAGLLPTDSVSRALDRLETYMESVARNPLLSTILGSSAVMLPDTMLYYNGSAFVGGTPDIIRGILNLAPQSRVSFKTVTADAFITTSPTGISFTNIAVTSQATATSYTTGAIVCSGGIAATQPSYFGSVSAGSLTVRPAGAVVIYNSVDATYTTGAVVCAGGMSVAKQLYVGTAVNTPAVVAGNIAATTAAMSQTLTSPSATLGLLVVSGTADATTPMTGSITVAGGIGIAKTANIAGRLRVSDSTESRSLSSGCAIMSGGLAVTKSANVGGNLSATTAQLGYVSVANNIISAPTNLLLSPSGEVLLSRNNVSPLGVATISQLQLSAAGIVPYLATTTIVDVPLIAICVLDTLGGAENGTLPLLGGYAPNVNDRVLVNGQSDPAQNGIYTLTDPGSDTTPWLLTRASDFNSIGNISANAVVSVTGGSSAGGTFILLGAGPFTVGHSAIAFTHFATIPVPLQIGNSVQSGSFGSRNVCQLGPTDIVGTAFDKVVAIIDKIAPASPLKLDVYAATYPFELANATYNAYSTRTHLIVNVVVDTTTPYIADTGLGFGSSYAGTLAAFYTDSVAVPIGAINLAASPYETTSTANQLEVTRLPFSAIETSVSVAINTDASIAFVPSNVLLRNMYLTHVDTITRYSNIVAFYVDDAHATTPYITNVSVLSCTNGRYVSGVRVLQFGDTITIRCTINNCVGLFYNSQWVAQVGGLPVITAQFMPTAPSAGTIVASITVSVANLSFSPNCPLEIVCQNAASTQSAVFNFSNARALYIDSASVAMPLNESVRIAAGNGLYPSLGAPFSPATSLAVSAELQLVGGAYGYPPPIDYSANYLPSPNYTGFTNFRYAAFIFPDALVCAVSFDIILTLPDPTRWADDFIQPAGEFLMQVQVDGGAIFDANALFNYITPSANGDACLDSTKSSLTVKHITFGFTPRTGTVIVRIGFPPGSQKTISNIVIANVVQ